jgi:hypothetical protein
MSHIFSSAEPGPQLTWTAMISYTFPVTHLESVFLKTEFFNSYGRYHSLTGGREQEDDTGCIKGRFRPAVLPALFAPCFIALQSLHQRSSHSSLVIGGSEYLFRVSLS